MKNTIISFIFIFIFVFRLCSQEILYHQEFQVNTYTPGNQFMPTVAVLKNGEFVVCWQSVGQDGSEGGIYAQLFDSAGKQKRKEFIVNTVTEQAQQFPSVASLKDGGFVVCWENWGTIEGSIYDVYCQIFDNSGNKKGNQIRVNRYTLNFQGKPSVVGLKGGGFVVCWESLYQDGSEYGIFAQQFDATGNKKGDEFRVNTHTNNYQCNSTIANLTDGGFVVCWEDYNQGIVGQIFSEAGAKKGSEFLIDGSLVTGGIRPSVAGLQNEGFVVCWLGDRYTQLDINILCQIFDGYGTKKGQELQINNNSNRGDGYSIAGLSSGGFVVCWQRRYQDDYWYDIMGQLYDASGLKVKDEFLVVNKRKFWQEDPIVVASPDGKFMVCWESGWQDGANWGVFGSFFHEHLIHPLQPFSLIEPLNDATLRINRPTFRWQQPGSLRECFPWEVIFDLYIDSEIHFSYPRILKNIQDTTYTLDSLLAGKTYFWKVLAKNLAGDSLWSTQQDWGFYISPNATLVETAEKNLPVGFELFQNSPNPFNSSTEIKYSLPKNKLSYHVNLKIYDIRGRLVKVLVDQDQSSGIHTVSWDGLDMNGNGVSSGIYFYTLQIGDFKMTKKMVLTE